MAVPYWRRASLGTHEVDVLVVGAGVCGLSAGHDLLSRGLRVAIVERSHLGAGASSRNAGFLMRGMADNYAAAVRDYGRDLARTMWRWTEENLQIMLSRGVGTLASFRRVPSCLLALNEKEHGELRASHDLLREDGFDVGWLDRHDDSVWGPSKALGGLVNPHDASANSWEVLNHLAAPLRPFLFEGQELLALTHAPAVTLASSAPFSSRSSAPYSPTTPLAPPAPPALFPPPGTNFASVVGLGRPNVLASTTTLTFRARRVLICTNAYAPRLLPALARIVAPKRGQMLAILPDRPYRLDFSYYASHGAEYFRQTPEGVVVLGGKRRWHEVEEVGYDDHPSDAIQGLLDDYARDVLGLTGQVLARWAGIMGFTPDGMPAVGPVDVPGCPPDSIWFCGGFTGHGMSLAARTVRAAVVHMLDGVATPVPLARFA